MNNKSAQWKAVLLVVGHVLWGASGAIQAAAATEVIIIDRTAEGTDLAGGIKDLSFVDSINRDAGVQMLLDTAFIDSEIFTYSSDINFPLHQVSVTGTFVSMSDTNGSVSLPLAITGDPLGLQPKGVNATRLSDAGIPSAETEYWAMMLIALGLVFYQLRRPNTSSVKIDLAKQ